MKKIYEQAKVIVMVIGAQDAIATSSGTSDATENDISWQD